MSLLQIGLKFVGSGLENELFGSKLCILVDEVHDFGLVITEMDCFGLGARQGGRGTASISFHWRKQHG